jgi:tetratricopeptide (TPR) repeat protein
MRKILLTVLLAAASASIFFLLPKGQCPLSKLEANKQEQYSATEKKDQLLQEANELLRTRKDTLALKRFEEILSLHPDNLDALWGKAEVLRRNYDYKQSYQLLISILDKYPQHTPSLISLSYLYYKDDKLDEAQKLLKRVLNTTCLSKQDEALANLMLGAINSRRSGIGGIFSKLKYGTRIGSYFLRAKALAPELPEVRLGLGTFYLLAPKLAGGNLDKALKELQDAVNIAPDFATANARLADAYKKKGQSVQYDFYNSRANALGLKLDE